MTELVFIALFQAAVAGADPAPPAVQPAPPATEQQSAAAPERERCRMVTREGSNLRERRCTTASQDEEMNQASAGVMRDMQAQAGRHGSLVGE